MDTVSIYGLVDPRTMIIRYIGFAANPNKRFGDHLRQYKYEKTHKSNWIRSLVKRGLKPSITVLEEVPADDWQWYEKWWIVYGRTQHWPLTNMTLGGEGNLGRTLSQESKERIGQAQKGKIVSEETRIKLSIAAKGRKGHWTGKSFSNEHRSNLSKSKIGNKNALGHSVSEESKNNIRKAMSEHKRVGEDSPISKVKSSEVIQMRELYDTGNYTVKKISDMFSHKYKTVWNIVNRQNWKHLP